MMKRTTQVPNELFDRYLPHLTVSELKILLVIIRQTNGWVSKKTGRRKTRDRISRSQFMQKTGLSQRSISGALQSLVETQMIRVSDSGGKILREAALRKGKGHLYYSLWMPLARKTYPRAYKMLPIRELL